jgi:ABC-2 type transport system permease protein
MQFKNYKGEGKMQILTMIKNQLKLLLSNRIAILAIILAPLLVTYLFSFSNNGSNKTNVYLVDKDNSKASKQLISMIKNHEDLNVIIDSEEEVKSKVDNNDIPVATVIERGFENNLRYGKTLDVKMIENYDNTDAENISETILSEGNTLKKITGDSKNISEVLKLDNENVSKQLINKTSMDNSITLLYKTINAGQKEEDKNTVTLIGFIVMFLWFVIIQGFRTLIEEKENGTFIRIIGAPMNYTKYLISKIIAALILGIAVTIVVLIAAKFILNASIVNNIFAVMCIFTIYLFALIGIVMIFANFVKKHQTFTIFGAVIMALTGMLGGCFFSIDELAPKTIQIISKFMPESWAIKALKNIMFNNLSLYSQLSSIFVLFLIGVLGLVISTILTNINMKTEKNI